MNNKGFAITSIIYSMLVLFLALVLLIMSNLASRKVAFDKEKSDLIGELAALNVSKYDFAYNGTYQTFRAPVNGTYTIQLWGAEGGGNAGGKGGYVRGDITLEKDDILYIYVGQHYPHGVTYASAFNGGGLVQAEPGTSYGLPNRYSTGGGATDVRLVSGNWNNFESLKSRIMVAGGGGGGYENYNYLYGGAGGGLKGSNGTMGSSGGVTISYGGTQISGGQGGTGTNTNGFPGGFGYGGSATKKYLAAGGGGYYGGGTSGVSNSTAGTGAGGSSFISGHNGCNAIDEASIQSQIIHTGQSNHYSGYTFTNTKMVDGNGYNWTTVKSSYTGMPSYSSYGTMTGNSGNGYARITLK